MRRTRPPGTPAGIGVLLWPLALMVLGMWLFVSVVSGRSQQRACERQCQARGEQRVNPGAAGLFTDGACRCAPRGRPAP